MKNRQPNGVRTAGAAQSEIRAVLTLLSDTPKQIARIARGSSDQQLHRRPDADAWSAQEVVAHLRACAEVWGRSIDRMLAEEHPTIRYVSPRGWIRKTNYLQVSFRDTVRAFSQERAVLVRTLSKLTASGWARGATFTATTLGRNATVLSYATRIADHEVRHLDQLRRTLGGRKRLNTADS
jgi:DinB family protein